MWNEEVNDNSATSSSLIIIISSDVRGSYYLISAVLGPDNKNVLNTNFLDQTLQPTAVFSNSTLLDSGPANGSHGVPENNYVALRKFKVEAWWRPFVISSRARRHVDTRSTAWQMNASLIWFDLFRITYLTADRHSAISVISDSYTTFLF